MKFIRFGFILILSCLFLQSNGQELSVMTYNIRLDVASDSLNSWPHRKDYVISQIKFYEPDIFGVQEAKPNQMQVLEENLKDYKAIGLGRDGNQEGEHSSIFYLTEKFKLIESGTFWLSESQEVASLGWDANITRICTYAKFKHNEKKVKFWVFNTHLDHKGVVARQESIKLILSKIGKLNIDNLPVILMGDFNLEPNSKAILELKNHMKDSRDLAEVSHGPEATFNGFKTNEIPNRRIDYIFLMNKKSLEVKKHAVIAEYPNLKYPSDHFPVYVEFKMK